MPLKSSRCCSGERYEPKDLFDELVAQGWIELVSGVWSTDDTLLEKPYARLLLEQ